MFSSRKQQVGIQIAIIYFIAIVLMVGIGALALLRLDSISKTVHGLINNLGVDRALADNIVQQVTLTRFYAHSYINSKNQADVDHFNTEFTELEALLMQAEQEITNPHRVEMLNNIVRDVKDYGEAFNQVTTLIRKQQKIDSEVLDVQELVMLNKLAALRVHATSLNEPRVFLAITNGQDAFHMMRLNAEKYLAEGDERYSVQLDNGYQQAQAAFSSLEATLEDPTQRKNVAAAKAAIDTYYEGFQTIHDDYLEMKNLFETKLDILEPKISNNATEMAMSVEQDFEEQNKLSQTLINQTRLVLLTTMTIAIIVGLFLGIVINRRFAERERAKKALHEVQEKLIRQERLAALGQLAGGVGHELRNPLGVISNAVYFLQMSLTDIDETTQEYLEMIDSETKNADKIITDLLDFARVKSAHRLNVNVLNLITEVTQKHPVPDNVTLTMSLPEDLPSVNIDPIQIRLVLTNLVTNAHQAMPEGGVLSIQSSVDNKQYSVNSEQLLNTENYLLISVSDTGAGISAENLEKIFEPLFTTKSRGIGLGLAISKTLVEANGGMIDVESTEGEGSTFQVYLPVSDKS